MPVSNATVATGGTRAISWQMWVPCVGMALCSWLSFVDRQVLAILSPTILKDTGLTNQDFTNAASFFFLTYTLGNPVWGSVLDHIGLRRGMLLAVSVWTVASMSHAWMTTFVGFALVTGGAGSRGGRHLPRRSAHGGRVAAARAPCTRHRALVQRRHDWRRDDAAPARTAGHPLRLADRVHRHRRARFHLAAASGRRSRARRSCRRSNTSR